MSLISTEKAYKKLISFGCSISTGFTLGELGSWGYVLSQKLGCDHLHMGGEGNSNLAILNRVIDCCESQDISNCCIGVQWTNFDRREFWSESKSIYTSFGIGAAVDPNNLYRTDEFKFIYDNLEFFEKIWFNYRENLCRTVNIMVLAKSYLKEKNVDFLMFEGIGSIKKDWAMVEKIPPVKDFSFLSDQFIDNLLSDPHFFSEFGDMKEEMERNDLFDHLENGGHPNLSFVNWWCDRIYEYLERSNDI
jgi:hypothetical protein